jgi:TPP-dependent pyruvate/acetoin dehydrogenase alpha subunit
MLGRINEEIKEAFKYAEEAAFPEEKELYTHVTDERDSGLIPWLDS